MAERACRPSSPSTRCSCATRSFHCRYTPAARSTATTISPVTIRNLARTPRLSFTKKRLPPRLRPLNPNDWPNQPGSRRSLDLRQIALFDVLEIAEAVADTAQRLDVIADIAQ